MSHIEMMNVIHSIENLSEKRKLLIDKLSGQRESLRDWLHALWAPLFKKRISISFGFDDIDDDDESDAADSLFTDNGEITYMINLTGEDCSEWFHHKSSDLLSNFTMAIMDVRDRFDYVLELLNNE